MQRTQYYKINIRGFFLFFFFFSISNIIKLSCTIPLLMHGDGKHIHQSVIGEIPQICTLLKLLNSLHQRICRIFCLSFYNFRKSSSGIFLQGCAFSEWTFLRLQNPTNKRNKADKEWISIQRSLYDLKRLSLSWALSNYPIYQKNLITAFNTYINHDDICSFKDWMF